MRRRLVLTGSADIANEMSGGDKNATAGAGFAGATGWWARLSWITVRARGCTGKAVFTGEAIEADC